MHDANQPTSTEPSNHSIYTTTERAKRLRSHQIQNPERPVIHRSKRKFGFGPDCPKRMVCELFTTMSTPHCACGSVSCRTRKPTKQTVSNETTDLGLDEASESG